jgi:hypothetical protein
MHEVPIGQTKLVILMDLLLVSYLFFLVKLNGSLDLWHEESLRLCFNQRYVKLLIGPLMNLALSSLEQLDGHQVLWRKLK